MATTFLYRTDFRAYFYWKEDGSEIQRPLSVEELEAHIAQSEWMVEQRAKGVESATPERCDPTRSESRHTCPEPERAGPADCLGSTMRKP